jgi:tetratricopeptide (TPR) repeat protein
MSLCTDDTTKDFLENAHRYAVIASLLDPTRKDVPSILAEIEAKKAASGVERGDYVAATNHADAAIAYAGYGAPEEAAPLLQRLVELARKDNQRGFYYSASVLLRRASILAQRLFGPDHPNTLTIRGNLANTLRSQGRYDEAEPLEREVLTAREKALGSEHPDTLIARGNLASTLHLQGRYEEAEGLYREVLAAHEEVLGPEHRDTLTTRGNLANNLRLQGRYEEAEPLEREVLAAREKATWPAPSICRAATRRQRDWNATSWWRERRPWGRNIQTR